MQRAFSLSSAAVWAFVACGCLAASCDDQGVTSSCPPLPLYQAYPLGDASLADAATAEAGSTQAAYAAAVDAGCATAPTQFPYDAATGAGGEGGSAGMSGSAGDAGASGAR